jgi:hypothetical protein
MTKNTKEPEFEERLADPPMDHDDIVIHALSKSKDNKAEVRKLLEEMLAHNEQEMDALVEEKNKRLDTIDQNRRQVTEIIEVRADFMVRRKVHLEQAILKLDGKLNDPLLLGQSNHDFEFEDPAPRKGFWGGRK